MINKDQVHFKNLRTLISEKTNDIIIWCGAGLSSDAGLPSWSKLKHNLINDAELEFNDKSDDISKKLTRIKNEPDLWISFSMLKDLLGLGIYQALIR